MGGQVSATALAELVREVMRHRTIESVAIAAPNPEAFKRRLYDILHGKCERVTLRVADEICIAFSHPEWLNLLV